MKITELSRHTEKKTFIDCMLKNGQTNFFLSLNAAKKKAQNKLLEKKNHMNE
jgi:hypothetical protein